MERAAPWLGLAAVVVCTLGIVSLWEGGEVARPAASPPAAAQARPSVPVRRASMNPAVAPSGDVPSPLEAAAFVDLFPRQDWAPPPPPPAPPSNVPPPPAQPPPLPFSIGALWQDGSGAFYAVLNAQGRDFPVCVACRQSGFYRQGDVLLGSYRIEKLTSREVQFLYLPMKRRQQMSLGG
jgi:hypothetical protein